jgi:vancomycin resistance protein YoaR
VLLVLCIGGSALLYFSSLKSRRIVPGVLLADGRLGAVPFDALDAELKAISRRYLSGSVTLELPGGRTLNVKRGALGARVDVKEMRTQLESIGKRGVFISDLVDRVRARRGKLRVALSLELDRDTALAFFTRLKEELDRPAVPPKLDLEHQRVIPGRKGYAVQVYDCLVEAELGLRRGDPRVKLAVTELGSGKRERRLARLDIGHVLGRFETVYSLADKDKDRAHNLKVGASKIDGTILDPGEEFSFNKKVGKRTEAEGYRTAPVISEGELVDGMAGGACQLSSTLFAASFFAGLDLLSSRPHTRPSSYIKMGLDAAVAYPGTDLVLKNSYPFPVVIHFVVSRGKVRVRILGKKRPWRRIVFERTLKKQEPFKEILRKVDSIPAGKKVVAQVGVPGFTLERRRLFYGKGKEPEKTESREIRYPPNTQYINVGTGPANPDWKPPKERSPFGEVPEEFKMAR